LMSSTTALKVPQSSNAAPSSPAKDKGSKAAGNGEATANSKDSKLKISPEDISSPLELTHYIDNILDTLESKFDDMSSQILERMGQMSTRVDKLEASIQDIINGDVTVGQNSLPQSPAPGTPGIQK